MIRGFLFDYDGVMTKNNHANTPPSEKLQAILGLPANVVTDLFALLWPDYLRGKLSDDALWRFIEMHTGVVVPLEKRDIWSKWEDLRPLPGMTALVRSLQEKRYSVGLLTNVTPTTEQEVREGKGYEGFDFCIKSCEVGFAKPEPEIYELAIKNFKGLSPEEIVYIDDRERFLVPAHALGMITILSLNSHQVISDITTLLER